MRTTHVTSWNYRASRPLPDLSKALWESCVGLGVINGWVDFPAPPLWTIRHDGELLKDENEIRFPYPSLQSPSTTFGFYFPDAPSLRASTWYFVFDDGSEMEFTGEQIKINDSERFSVSLHSMLDHVPFFVTAIPSSPSPFVMVRTILQDEQALISGIVSVRVEFGIMRVEPVPYAWTVSALGM
jgi:hypothetical protein